MQFLFDFLDFLAAFFAFRVILLAASLNIWWFFL